MHSYDFLSAEEAAQYLLSSNPTLDTNSEPRS